MKKKAKNIIFGLVIAVAFVSLLGLIGRLTRESIDNTFEGVWLIEKKEAPQLLVYSQEYVPAKGAGNTNYYLHLLDAKSGKEIASTFYSVTTFENVQLYFRTGQNMWLLVNEEWTCVDLESLEEKYDQDTFYEKILSEHSEIKSIHSLFFDEDKLKFSVENNIGEEFLIDPYEFESKGKGKKEIVFLNRYNQLGKSAEYEISIKAKKEPEFFSIETIGEEKEEPEYEEWMSLEDKLDLDEGFAKNYAVFTEEETCLLLDGEKRRTLKFLASDIERLEWNKVIDKEWLNGELLRPYKEKNDIPSSRCVIVQNHYVFIYYQTSLEEEENDCRLAAINIVDREISWDKTLEALEINSTYKPVQNYVLDELIITVWQSSGDLFIISAHHASDGRLIWTFTD